MWFYFCFSLVLLHVISTNLAQDDTKNANDPNKDPETIFAGVIKNISRVNNVLQELISNYEHLQKIYKSQENLESASTDGEIDEVFKSKDKKVRTLAQATSNKPTDYFPATQVIWSNNEDYHDDSDNANSESNQSEKTETHQIKSEDGLDIKPAVEEQFANNDNHESSTSGDQEKSELEDQENSQKADRSETDDEEVENKRREPVVLSHEVVKPKQAEIIFVDTHKTTSSKKPKKRNKTPEEYQPMTPPKTRYSKVSHRNSEPKKKHLSKYKSKGLLRTEHTTENNANEKEPNNLDEPTNSDETRINPKNKNRNVEKKLHSESFSPHIWDEIISNKPIQLEAHNEMIFEKLRKDNRGLRLKKTIKMRSNNPKTTLVIVTKKNQTANIKKVHSKNKTIDLSDTEDSFGKDEFEADVLRKAYGDACLKLVVRKCYLALKEAGKSVCEKFKCKGTYKEKFDSFSRSACIKEFHGEKKSKSNKTIDNIFMNTRAKDSKGFQDLTREGYMQACLPHIQTIGRESDQPQETNPKNRNKTSLIRNVTLTSFNVLRDRYESACKKMSCRKCQLACRTAFKDICESYTCNSDRKKAYKKSCKRECKKIYKVQRDSSSYSDTDSSDSSDTSDSSDSDSNSDSDSDTS